jgi:hypothetical protein
MESWFSTYFWVFSAPIGTYPPRFLQNAMPIDPYRFLHRTAIRIQIGDKYDGLPMKRA